MKKTLIYHLYIAEDFDTNFAYKINHACLKNYINVFDKLNFTLTVDDLTNDVLINKGFEWIKTLGIKCEFNINVKKNDYYREAKTFYDNVIKSKEVDNEIYFFSHCKGISNYRQDDWDKWSIFYWICTLYFYSLEFIEDVEKSFTGNIMYTYPKMYYGSIMALYNREKYKRKDSLGCIEYLGSFYWINMPMFQNYQKENIIKNIKLDSRHLAEEFPGLYFKYKDNDGLTSRNNACIDALSFDFGTTVKEVWPECIRFLGDYDEFYKFFNKILEITGFNG